MKKMIFFLLTAFLCFNIGAFPAGAEDGTIRAWHITDSVETAYWHGILTVSVQETCTVKNKTVAVAANESLIVPKNVTLVLKRGARIDGTVYVQEGGKLRVSGGDFSVSRMGAVVSDGILSVGKNAALSVANGGEVFVGKTGKLSIANEESLRFGDMATVVCVGKTNAKNERIGKNLIAAYLTKDGATTLAEDPEAELPTSEMYELAFSLSEPIRITYIFDNGVCLSAVKNYSRFVYIGKFRVCTAVGYTFFDPYDESENPGAKYCLVEIVEIDGADCLMSGEGYVPVLPVLPDFSDLDGE